MPPEASTPTSLHRDDDLFAELACWVAPRLASPTWGGLLSWLDDWLDDGAARVLRHHVLLDDRDQRTAEARLVEFMGTSHELQVERCRLSEKIDRSVDWPRTYSDLGGLKGGVYWCRERTSEEDQNLSAALKGLGRTWSDLLARDASTNPDHLRRCEQLDRACGGESGHFVAFGPCHSRRLEAFGESGRALAVALGRVSERWERSLRDDDQGWRSEVEGRLRALAKSLALLSKNPDLALELSTRLVILKSVLANGAGPKWELERPLRNHYGRGPRQPMFVIRRGDLRCRVSKGRPFQMVGERRLEGGDRLVDVAREGCGLGATGNQPDVVMCFWRADEPRRVVFAFADAKRNDKGDGTTYLRQALEVGAAYCVSYGHLLGLSIGSSSNAKQALSSFVDPVMTLFCLQGAPDSKRPASKRLQVPELISRLKSEKERLPPILALDMGRHFPPSCSVGEDDRPVVRAWFDRLAGQADAVLGRGEGFYFADGGPPRPDVTTGTD